MRTLVCRIYLQPERVSLHNRSKRSLQSLIPLAGFLAMFSTFSFLSSSVTSLSFEFTRLGLNDPKIILEGDASCTGVDIQLTVNGPDMTMINSTGRVRYVDLLHLWDKDSGKVTNFSTHFSFVIDSQNSTPHADGLAFFLAPSDFPLPRTGGGQGLGLLTLNRANQPFNSSSEHFVAVEFDAWSNCILDGKQNDAWISYNSISKILQVNFTGYKNNTKILQNLSYRIDLSNYLPEWVTFGISAATGLYYEIHTLRNWNFSSDLQINSSPARPNQTLAPPPLDQPVQEPDKKNTTGLVVGLSIGFLVLLLGVGLLWFGVKRMCNGEKEEDEEGTLFDPTLEDEFARGTGPRRFSYFELARATNNFSEEEKLGEGGFGGVYKGYLRELGDYVAIKRVSRGSEQGEKEYASEVRIISRLRHRNLVQLMGWCHEKRELLLVYELMSEGSLYTHLFKSKDPLIWNVRYKIAQGLASALLYLHEGWEQCVLHRDIKSSNIMLDSSFNAKLGDFGLARLVDHAKGSQTTMLAGTMGYMAPECATTGQATKESDIYSFGMVMLEIACGRKPIIPVQEGPPIRLVELVWDLFGTGQLCKAVDPRLGNDFDEQEMECLIVVGLWCAHPDSGLRPSIRQVNHVLNFEAPFPTLPPKMPVPSYRVPLPVPVPVPVPVVCSALASSSASSTAFEIGKPEYPSSYSNKTDSSKLTAASAASSPSQTPIKLWAVAWCLPLSIRQAKHALSFCSSISYSSSKNAWTIISCSITCGVKRFGFFLCKLTAFDIGYPITRQAAAIKLTLHLHLNHFCTLKRPGF
ncbi:Legume lectin domain [Dillenia turbinata]|uniref:Legume lectin domain n=1 Tax=Dillenia turbinata TaxID=194707 RepID=A0AAN8WDB7_9MAGN